MRLPPRRPRQAALKRRRLRGGCAAAGGATCSLARSLVLPRALSLVGVWVCARAAAVKPGRVEVGEGRERGSESPWR